MTHDDFMTLEVESVIGTMLNHCQQSTGAKAVHWLSAHGLYRVVESTDETWHWAFSSVDILGTHAISRPGTADVWDLYMAWKKVVQLYPQPWKAPLSPHALGGAGKGALYAVPLMFQDSLLGIVLFDGVEKNAVKIFAEIKPGLDIAAKYVAFCYQTMEAKNMSYEDELTGLYNQRYLPMVLEHEIQRASRENTHFSLLFLDIDYFKMVNDGRGHWVGSKLLVELAKVLSLQVRGCDYCFRYGGDEFIVLLGGANAENAKKVAERIRKAVESHTFVVEGHSMNLTVSIGLAAYPDHAQSASDLIQIADQAMYYGKRKSRNIVFVAS